MPIFFIVLVTKILENPLNFLFPLHYEPCSYFCKGLLLLQLSQNNLIEQFLLLRTTTTPVLWPLFHDNLGKPVPQR